MEIFKTIPSFPDYLVSQFGRVKTKSRKLRYVHAVTGNIHYRQTNERFLKVQVNNNTGYKFHQLYLKGKMYNKPVHQLVADAFLKRKTGKSYINHIDGNKHNNVVDNLEWCTNEYNHLHATITGLKPKGERVGTSILTDKMVHAIKWFLKRGVSHSELAVAFGISKSSITLINTGKTWRHIALTGEELIVKF